MSFSDRKRDSGEGSGDTILDPYIQISGANPVGSGGLLIEVFLVSVTDFVGRSKQYTSYCEQLP